MSLWCDTITVMKYLIVVLIILAIIIFFSTQNHPPTPISPNATVTTNNGSTVGQESGTSSCKATHIDTTDPQAYLPDPNCTPGVLNDAVTQANMNQTICVPGYTKTIRPPASYTSKLKREQIVEYGYTDTSSRDYEEDHFISLELGGNPTDPKNLWPEPHASTNEKDTVEDYLHKQVCAGAITLAQAQKEITTNWYTVYQQIK